MTYYLMLSIQFAILVVNNVDPDEMLHSAASHLDLHCLLRLICPNIYSKNGKLTKQYPLIGRPS